MLGGNIGDTRQVFRDAMEAIQSWIGHIDSISSLYRSAPWGFEEQEPFLNQALLVKTELSPAESISVIAVIEKSLGKEPLYPNGPRKIDIDIMFYNNLIINTESLIIPHPRLHLRRFNLLPLAEILPDFVHPILHQTIKSLLKDCEDPLEVHIIN